MDPQSPQPNSQYPPQMAPPVGQPEPAAADLPASGQAAQEPEPAPAGPPVGPRVQMPGETGDINTLVREVQLADGIDVGRNWYSTLKINPQSDTQGMFDTFMTKYREDFPFLELPDESTKRFPKQSAMDLGAKIIRPGERPMSYESGVAQGYLPIDTRAEPVAGEDGSVQATPSGLPEPSLPAGYQQSATLSPAPEPAPKPAKPDEPEPTAPEPAAAAADEPPLPKLPKAIQTPRKGFR